MFIEVADDIIYAASDPKSTCHDAAVCFLQKASLAARYGKHLIFVPILHNETFSTEPLQRFLLKSQIITLKHVKKVTEKRLKSRLKTFMLVSFKRINQIPSFNIIHYNPLTLDSFEIHEEAHLIVENIDDAEFYKIVANYIIAKKAGFSINFLARQGGGVTIHTVAQQELDYNCHLCLAIADSDKKYLGDTIGSTASKLAELKSKSDFLEIYILDKVCEIENLIPYNVLSYFSSKRQKEHLKKNLSFFDFKCGLKYKEVQSLEKNNYWISIFGTDAKIPQPETVNEGNKDKTINGFEGYGSDILSKVLDLAKSDKPISHSIHNPSDLRPSQLEEWTNIGQLLFDWCCAGRPIRL